MRIITGKYKGRRFEPPRTFKARPTTDFAKENLFNVLRAYVDFEACDCLDLFGGTGSITAELLSRGCRHVVTVEKDRQHYAFICAVLRQLGADNASPLQADALRYISRCRAGFDLVFADPPYALPELPELPDRILSGQCVKPGGLLVLEHGRRNNFRMHPLFVEQREYGSVNFSFFRQAGASGEEQA